MNVPSNININNNNTFKRAHSRTRQGEYLPLLEKPLKHEAESSRDLDLIT